MSPTGSRVIEIRNSYNHDSLMEARSNSTCARQYHFVLVLVSAPETDGRFRTLGVDFSLHEHAMYLDKATGCSFGELKREAETLQDS